MKIEEIEITLLDLKYERLRVTSYHEEKKLLCSVSETGQQVPIIVIEKGQRFTVIDGYKRVKVLKRLNEDLVKAVVWKLKEPEALLAAYQITWGARSNIFEQAWLIYELHYGHGISLEELAKRFMKTKSWISRRISLVRDLPGWIQEEVRRGKVAPYSAMKYLVPLARANRTDCEKLLRKIVKNRFTTREIGEIYSGYLSGPSRVKRRIIEDPSGFLKAKGAMREPQSPLPYLRKIALVGDIVESAAISIRRENPVDSEELNQLDMAWSRTKKRIEFLSTVIKETKDAG